MFRRISLIAALAATAAAAPASAALIQGPVTGASPATSRPLVDGTWSVTVPAEVPAFFIMVDDDGDPSTPNRRIGNDTAVRGVTATVRALADAGVRIKPVVGGATAYGCPTSAKVNQALQFLATRATHLRATVSWLERRPAGSRKRQQSYEHPLNAGRNALTIPVCVR